MRKSMQHPETMSNKDSKREKVYFLNVVFLGFLWNSIIYKMHFENNPTSFNSSKVSLLLILCPTSWPLLFIFNFKNNSLTPTCAAGFCLDMGASGAWATYWGPHFCDKTAVTLTSHPLPAAPQLGVRPPEALPPFPMLGCWLVWSPEGLCRQSMLSSWGHGPRHRQK